MRHLIRIILDVTIILWSTAMLVVALIAAPAGAMLLGYLAVPYLRLDPLPPDMTWPWILGAILALAVLYWTAGLVTALAMKLIPAFKPRRRGRKTAADYRTEADQREAAVRRHRGEGAETPPGPPDHPGTPPQRVG